MFMYLPGFISILIPHLANSFQCPFLYCKCNIKGVSTPWLPDMLADMHLQYVTYLG